MELRRRLLAILALPVLGLGCGSKGPQGPFGMRETPTEVKTKQLVTTSRWPLAAPISVTLAPDAKRYAYTTAAGELYVRPLDGGDAKRWAINLDGAITIQVAGFYSDGSLAVLATTEHNEWRLYRVTEAGDAALVHSAASRLHAAISPVGDRTIIATETAISEVTPTGLRAIAVTEPADRILAIAISPDGTRIADMRDTEHDVTEQVHVTTMEGKDLGWKQRIGSSPGYGNELLAWIDNERFVFAGNDAANERHGTMIYGVGIEDGLAETRDVWPVDSYVGLGSAAKGILLVVRGRAVTGVVTGGANARSLARIGDAAATRVIGWTSDSRPVFTSGFWREERIMRGGAPWPGTQPGDAGVALAGDAVILNRMTNNGYAVERLDAAGKRTPLAQVSMADARWRPLLVRCAGESATPCMIEHVEYDHTSYFEFDPATGKRGELLHEHEVISTSGPTPNAALSPDGKLLAIVDEGATVTLVAGKTPHVTKLDGVGAIDSIAFGANDELWASARSVRGRAFAVLRMTLDRATMQLHADLAAFAPGDALRVYLRPTPSRDRTQLAIGVRDLQTEVTRVDGL